MKLTLLVVIFFLAFVFYPRNAWAYLDPGSGSFILQFIIAGLVGFSFMLKSFFKNLFAKIFRLFSRSRQDDQK